MHDEILAKLGWNLQPSASDEIKSAHVIPTKWDFITCAYRLRYIASFVVSARRIANFIHHSNVLLKNTRKESSCIFKKIKKQFPSRQRRVYHQCEALYIINTKCCISSSRREIHAKAWWDTAHRADDIRMYISPQASYTFNDMPSLRLG